jgi:hypothetical protein
LKVIKADLKSRFRSGVSILRCLIKHSRPDIASLVRELAKCIDGATLEAYKEMLRIIRFVLDTQLFCLKMEPISVGGQMARKARLCLSMSEAEYVAMTEAVKEIRYIYYLLVSLGI